MSHALVEPFEPGSVQDRIFSALRANPYGLTREELIDIIWSGNPGGGPLYADNGVHGLIHKMRHPLRRKYPCLHIENLSRSGRRYLLVIRKRKTPNMTVNVNGIGNPVYGAHRADRAEAAW
jgi:hypothetical protein